MTTFLRPVFPVGSQAWVICKDELKIAKLKSRRSHLQMNMLWYQILLASGRCGMASRTNCLKFKTAIVAGLDVSEEARIALIHRVIARIVTGRVSLKSINDGA